MWLEGQLCLMAEQMCFLEPNLLSPGWKQITGNNSASQSLLPRLAAPQASEAQLLRPQDKRLRWPACAEGKPP